MPKRGTCSSFPNFNLQGEREGEGGGLDLTWYRRVAIASDDGDNGRRLSFGGDDDDEVGDDD